MGGGGTENDDGEGVAVRFVCNHPAFCHWHLHILTLAFALLHFCRVHNCYVIGEEESVIHFFFFNWLEINTFFFEGYYNDYSSTIRIHI